MQFHIDEIFIFIKENEAFLLKIIINKSMMIFSTIYNTLLFVISSNLL